MNSSTNQRVIALVDMDCFFCQVEARLDPSLKGKPMAVVQYNQWKGGGIIAVNYEARNRGVTRFMRGTEAKEKCSEIVLVSVPTVRGKADLTNYRDAGEEVADVFSEFCSCVQRASIDEAFLDLTKEVDEYIKTHGRILPDALPNTYVVGHCNLEDRNEDDRAQGLAQWLQQIESDGIDENTNYRLAVGGVIIEKMRARIFEKTGFHCSAGIAHNKILAKLSAGLHKPQKQTLLPQDNVLELYETLPVHKVRSLGGKFGKQVVEKLSIKTMAELYNFSLQELQQKFDEKTSHWLYNIARGIDLEPVTPRLKSDSIGCSKNFTGTNRLTQIAKVEHWLKEMASEISERLQKDYEKNKRKAKLLTVTLYQESLTTKCGPLNSYEASRIASDAMQIIKKFNSATIESGLWKPPIKLLGLSASKFTEEVNSIKKFLTARGTEEPDRKGSKTPEESLENISPATSGTSSTVQSESNPSFFINYFKERRKKIALKTLEKEVEANDDDEDGTAWVSLSELIPDVNEADVDIVDILPEPMKKKFRERLNSNSKNSEFVADTAHGPLDRFVQSENQIPSETCNECGKKIPLDVFLEHLDYHVALKLSSEINVRTPTEPKKAIVEPEVQSKRKKGTSIEMSSKKMKSITSFFAVTPK